MTGKDSLTHERLRTLLDYDPDTGLLTRRTQACPQRPVGYSPKSGYWRVGVGGRQYYYSRVVWFWVTGDWPIDEIDHEDRDKSNHRWGNLRDLAHGQNMQNIQKAQCNSTTGIRGVHPENRSFIAKIGFEGKVIRIGTFKTKEEAAIACANKKAALHPFAAP